MPRSPVQNHAAKAAAASVDPRVARKKYQQAMRRATALRQAAYDARIKASRLAVDSEIPLAVERICAAGRAIAMESPTNILFTSSFSRSPTRVIISGRFGYYETSTIELALVTGSYGTHRMQRFASAWERVVEMNVCEEDMAKYMPAILSSVARVDVDKLKAVLPDKFSGPGLNKDAVLKAVTFIADCDRHEYSVSYLSSDASDDSETDDVEDEDEDDKKPDV
jgi:hypothetical protein